MVARSPSKSNQTDGRWRQIQTPSNPSVLAANPSGSTMLFPICPGCQRVLISAGGHSADSQSGSLSLGDEPALAPGYSLISLSLRTVLVPSGSAARTRPVVPGKRAFHRKMSNHHPRPIARGGSLSRAWEPSFPIGTDVCGTWGAVIAGRSGISWPSRALRHAGILGSSPRGPTLCLNRLDGHLPASLAPNR